jgi:hypothetical protein
MIRSRLSITDASDEAVSPGFVPAWEFEWMDEVQKLLEMDAGWGWRGFWECVKDNINVSSAIPPASV